ncbi:hypothetical protein F5Y11DRAFT_187784 [Daldinia sp. FL1419]|nr:hypothetical protein F5Y11DRAFT_187784 [Daldinia sp. FL1419]
MLDYHARVNPVSYFPLSRGVKVCSSTFTNDSRLSCHLSLSLFHSFLFLSFPYLSPLPLLIISLLYSGTTRERIHKRLVYFGHIGALGLGNRKPGVHVCDGKEKFGSWRRSKSVYQGAPHHVRGLRCFNLGPGQARLDLGFRNRGMGIQYGILVSKHR